MEKNNIYYSIDTTDRGVIEVESAAEARKAMHDGYYVEKVTRTHIKSGKTHITITVVTEIDDPALL